MYRISTSEKSDLALIAALFILLLLSLASCTARVEKEVSEQQKAMEAVVAEEDTAVTVAVLHDASDEIYFDLVAKTSGCFGEDLWLGGKMESKRKVVRASSGALFQAKEYLITEVTATGLSSNKVYAVQNGASALKGVSKGDGVIHLQLMEGHLEVLSQSNTHSVVLAYEPVQLSKKLAGTWNCQ